MGKSLPPGLEDSLPTNLQETFDTARSGVRQSAEAYIGLCNLLERLIKRNQGVAADQLRFSHALTALTENSQATYAVDTSDVPSLNQGIISTARHLATGQALLEDESRAWDEGVLEDCKKQRDTLVSVRDMFDRRDRYAKDNIPQLERRIESNESKLSSLMNRPAGAPVKPGEQEKLEQAVRAVSKMAYAIFKQLIRRRISNRSLTSMLAGCSSRSVFATSSSISSNHNTTSAGCIKTGAKSGLSMQSCTRIIGEH